MGTDFSIGNRVEHPQHGEGMVVNVKDEKIDVLFFNDQKHTFSANNFDLKLLELPKYANDEDEGPLPSAAHKIQRELDQLKVENRVDFFDYEYKKPKNTDTLVDNSRVTHSVYGDGMITKILKNEYQIIFVDGSKQNIPMDSPELKFKSAQDIDDKLSGTSIQNESKFGKGIIFLGKHVTHPEFGEGMISKITNNDYEIIFIDGSKKVFSMSQKRAETKGTSINMNTLPLAETKLTTDKKNIPMYNESTLIIGKQIIHPEYGEGMVSKISSSDYEIIFLDGTKQKFPFSKKANIAVNEEKKSNFETDDKFAEFKVETAKETPNKPLSNQSTTVSVGKQISHPEYGDGMVSKNFGNEYEVIFLDGQKRKFSITDNIFANVQDNLPNEPMTINERKDFSLMDKIEAIFEKKTPKSAEIKVGKQIKHPVYGEGMISKISGEEYEIIFIDGQKMKFLLEDGMEFSKSSETTVYNENQVVLPINVDIPSVKKPVKELPIEKYQKKVESQFEIPIQQKEKTEEFKLDITDKVAATKIEVEEKEVELSPPKPKKAESEISLNSLYEKYKTDEIQIGTAVKHPKNGIGIVCNIDEFEIEVVFYKHKKIVFSAQDNALTFLNSGSDKSY